MGVRNQVFLCLILFLSAVAISPVVAAGPSMMFRMNPQHTGDYSSVSGGIIPNNQLKWTFTMGKSMSHSPAVVDGVVYVGSWDSRVYAIDASTGTQRWVFTTGDSVDSSPAVADSVVYVTCMDNKVYAIDAATGTQKWIFTTGGSVYSSPTVADGVVYVG